MSAPMPHFLKTWSKYFAAVKDGSKRFEVRRDDRHFKVDDLLHLEEWDLEKEQKTGEFILCRVTYKLDGGAFGIAPGFCVLGIEVLS